MRKRIFDIITDRSEEDKASRAYDAFMVLIIVIRYHPIMDP